MSLLLFFLIVTVIGYACCAAAGRADDQSEACWRSLNDTHTGKGEKAP